MFHRETGNRFLRLRKDRYPPTHAGDELSPTQPFPVKPPPLVRQGITPDDAWGATFYDRRDCRKKIESMRYGPIYTPITDQPTLMFPQVGGGSNWGGGAIDPRTNMLVTPVAQFPYWVQLVPNEDIDPKEAKTPRAGTPQGPAGYMKGSDYGVQQAPLLSVFGAPCTEAAPGPSW